MENINQLYKSLLNKEIDSLVREGRERYEKMTRELSGRGMIRSGIHIERALEIETDNMRRFINRAISEYIRLIQAPEADSNELEKIYRSYINGVALKIPQSLKDTLRSIMSPTSSSYFEPALERLKSEALRELDIAKAEQKFKLTKETTPTINITNSAVGVLNLGNITGNIEHNIAALQHSGHRDIADILQELIDGLNTVKEEIGEHHLEILSHLLFLTEEANKPQEQRNIPVVKRVVSYIPEAISISSGLITIWDKIGPQIARFFGLI